MNPTPPPEIPAITLQQAPSHDWQVWAAFAPLIAAVIAGLIAAAALWQRRRADNRSEWWRRAQWAMDATLSDKPIEAVVGQRAIKALAQSRLASREEFVFLRVATEDPIDAVEDQYAVHMDQVDGPSPPADVDQGTESRDNGGASH